MQEKLKTLETAKGSVRIVDARAGDWIGKDVRVVHSTPAGTLIRRWFRNAVLPSSTLCVEPVQWEIV